MIKSSEAVSNSASVLSRIKVYAAFTKMRLASLVVFSAVVSYLYAAESVSFPQLFILSIGGFLVTGASNGMNQIIEKDFDKLMDRTSNRPIPSFEIHIPNAKKKNPIVDQVQLCGFVCQTKKKQKKFCYCSHS